MIAINVCIRNQLPLSISKQVIFTRLAARLPALVDTGYKARKPCYVNFLAGNVIMLNTFHPNTAGEKVIFFLPNPAFKANASITLKTLLSFSTYWCFCHCKGSDFISWVRDGPTFYFEWTFLLWLRKPQVSSEISPLTEKLWKGRTGNWNWQLTFKIEIGDHSWM